MGNNAVRSITIIILLIAGFGFYKIEIATATIQRDNVREIKVYIPKSNGKSEIVISGSDFDNLINSYNTARIIHDNGGYIGYTIEINVYLKDGKWVTLIEDGPKTVRVAYHKGHNETRKKIEAPWIAEYIHNLRVSQGVMVKNFAKTNLFGRESITI